MRYKLLLLLLTFLLLVATPANALEIRQVDYLPFSYAGFDLRPADKVEVPSVQDVVYEIQHLEGNLLFLKEMPWPVYIVSRQCFHRGMQVTGASNSDKAVLFARQSYQKGIVWVIEDSTLKTALAAPYLAAFTVAHEAGHLVRFNCVTREELREYLKMRGDPGVDPEELFAEDFRWLFGSDRAKVIEYQHNIPPPGQREREFMLKVFKA